MKGFCYCCKPKSPNFLKSVLRITTSLLSSRNLQVFLSHLTCILLICGSLGNAEAETVFDF